MTMRFNPLTGNFDLDTTGGTPGPEGMSAYDIAVLEGFVGDEAAWLASLRAAHAYTHPQNTPDDEWIINHNLGFRPAGILVFDSAGTEWMGEPEHVDDNTLIIRFTAAFGGVAYLS